MMKLKNNIRFAIDILKNPGDRLKKIDKQELDPLIGKYLSLLFMASLLAGVSIFVLNMLKSVYFDVFLRANIDYMGALNYAAGISVSVFFLYVFSGTILVILLSFVLKTILFRIKYVNLLKLIMYSLTPVLLFGWIPQAAIPLLIWSVFLFVTGMRN